MFEDLLNLRRRFAIARNQDLANTGVTTRDPMFILARL